MAWDFWSHSPESLHQVTILFSNRGIPKGYRHFNGYRGHTFKWVNNHDEAVWVKYHFKTDQGVQNLPVEDALRIAGEDPDYHTTDLFESIERGEYPSWTVHVQNMPYEDAWTYRFNPFDITKVWPHSDYPLQEIGKLVLNKNPDNYFAEVEQSAFSPANVVPGIEFSPDKMLQARIFAYADTDRYQLGVNYTSVPVNSPKNASISNYYRDGFMRVDDNGKGFVNYEPNSFGGPTGNGTSVRSKYRVGGSAGSVPYEKHAEDDDYTQAGNLYRMLPEDEKNRLIDNIAGDLKNVKPEIVKRQLAHFYKADKDYGARIANELGIKDLKV